MTKHICAYTTMINLCPLKKSVPIWTCSKSFANFFRSKIDRLQQFSFDEKNVLLISQVHLIMEQYFPLFFHGGTESLDLYYPPAPLWSTSFLLSLFRDQPLNHVFQAPMIPWCFCQDNTSTLFFTQLQICHLIYSVVFQNTEKWENQDDLLKHKFMVLVSARFSI